MNSREWIVLRIEPHNLPRARRELRGVAFIYCPMRVRFYRVRQKDYRTEIPLMVSYCFALAPANADAWHSIREAYGVQQILTGAGVPEKGRPWVYTRSEVRRLRTLEKAGEWDEAKKHFDAINRKRLSAKARKGKKFGLEDLPEVMHIMSEAAA